VGVALANRRRKKKPDPFFFLSGQESQNMELDPEVSQRVYGAFNAGDVEGFRQLLSDHPEFLRNSKRLFQKR
jgi:hypothetical protein